MRIAVVMCHADRRMTGARREIHVLRALAAAGAAVRIFRMHPGAEPEEESFLNGTVTAGFFPADNPAAKPRHRVSTALAEALRGFGPDLVLYKGLDYDIARFLQDAPGAAPAFGFIVGGAVTDLMLPRAALVLAEHEAQARTAFAAAHAAGRTMILPKYVDFALCGDGSPHPAPRHAIVNVGTFHDRRKNQAALLSMSPRHRIAFVGGGALLETVKAEAPPRSRARFYGHRPPEQVFNYILDSRIMVHPALHDGLPRAVVEAMACGRPVIAFRHVIPDGLTHGEHGLLVTPETLESEVEALLADPARIKAMGRAAFAHARAHHGEAALQAAARRLLEMVRNLGLG